MTGCFIIMLLPYFYSYISFYLLFLLFIFYHQSVFIFLDIVLFDIYYLTIILNTFICI